MNSRLLAPTLCLLALALPATADTFIMKDGSKFEGSILKEDANTITLSVRVTKSIKDERSINRADLLRVEREQAPAVDFSAISSLVPVPDRSPADEYAKRIKTVEKYLAEHKMTAKYKDAEQVLATLKAEAKQIEGGATKIAGQVLTAQEYKLNAYENDASIEAAKLQKLITGGQNLAALRAFTSFEADFRHTTAYQELLPAISQALANYLAEANSQLTSYDVRAKQRKAGLDRMSGEDRRITLAALLAEKDQLAKLYKSEKDNKITWVTLHPFSKDALADTVALGKTEQARLAKAKDAPFIDGGKAYREAAAAVQGPSDSDEAKAAIASALKTARKANLPDRYLAPLEAAAPKGSTVTTN